MDIEDFKSDVAATAKFLKALHRLVPKFIDLRAVEYLEQTAENPCGLEVLRNALEWEETVS